MAVQYQLADARYTARRRNLRISPQKLRLAADMIRGRGIQDALDLLSFSVTKSSKMMHKILSSAFANAEAQDADLDALVVCAVTVDKGMVLKRRMPSGRGRMRANFHRFSHVDLHLAEKRSKVVAEAAAKAKKKSEKAGAESKTEEKS